MKASLGTEPSRVFTDEDIEKVRSSYGGFYLLLNSSFFYLQYQ